MVTLKGWHLSGGFSTPTQAPAIGGNLEMTRHSIEISVTEQDTHKLVRRGLLGASRPVSTREALYCWARLSG